MAKINLTTPLTRDILSTLTAGDEVLLSGTVYTARDAAHARMSELIKSGKPLPFDIKNAVIYYVGPTPTPNGKAIGSAGPTTSSRMDSYTPTLLNLGLSAMIGKGKRSPEVIDSMVKNGAVYFGCVGGAAAITASHITENETIAYDDLGSEAIRKLYVKDMPLTVVIDARGNNLYETGPASYLASLN